jgi:aminoglycoside phosphotransferase (APT) family kinase protein
MTERSGGATAVMAVDEFEGELRAALAQELRDPELELTQVSRRGEGYSWETYIVTARGSGGDVLRYAVKRIPLAGIVGDYDVDLEVALLRTAAEELGCPVPAVIAHRSGNEATRGFYAMEMVDGVVPMPWTVKKLLPEPEVRRALGLELAGLMAGMHGKDVGTLRIADMVVPDDPRAVGAIEVATWRDAYLELTAVRLPILDLVFAWLEHRADAVSGRLALVHNDLRVGNFIVRDGRVAAILDWETAEFTDPAADLAKFNLPTFRGRSTLASGLVEWEEFLAAYEAVSGWRPSQAALDFWTVLEIAKTAVGCLRGAHFFDSGVSDDVRYANMAFQTHHSFRWLVDLYEDGVWGR